MSLENEAVVDISTDLESNLNETSEEVTSEQSELVEDQGVATDGNETEQTGETEDDFNLGEVLTGGTEPDENESKKQTNRSHKYKRKSKRLAKELEVSQKQVEQLRNRQPQAIQPQIPERDYDNETDEQYSFRSVQSALNHQQQVNTAASNHANQVQQASDNVKSQGELIEKYSDEVDKLNLPNYDDAESRILDMMPEGALSHMSALDASATAKIIYHLDHNPEKAAHFANLANTNANGFNFEFGKLATAINELVTRAERKHKTVSKAIGDVSLDNSGSPGSSLQSKMDAAANKGDIKLYRKLKALNKK